MMVAWIILGRKIHRNFFIHDTPLIGGIEFCFRNDNNKKYIIADKALFKRTNWLYYFRYL
jgi:hypothetical protein